MSTNPREPTPNPYQAPASDAESPSTGTLPDGTQVHGKLFSAGHVAWAVFLATPIAGCVLMAINYHRLEKANATKIMWFATITVFIGWVLMALMMPDDAPATILNLILVFVMYHIANSLQGRDIGRVMATGGKWASGWVATGIAILVAAAFFTVAFGLMMFLPEEWFFEEGEL